MKLNKGFVVSALLAIGLAVPAFAAAPGVARTPVAGTATQLASAKENAEHCARAATKGATAAEYRMKAVQLDDLIMRLNSGQKIPQEEIDRALK